MLTTLASYRLVSENLDRSLATTAAQPTVARQTEYYLENIESVKSIDDFLGNDRLFNYAMKAFGLEEMSYAKAFMRKVLTEGIDSEDAFANSLSDSRYKEFVKTFNFVRYGSTTMTFPEAQQETVDRYVRQVVEENAGDQNEGVRLALYFDRKASTITSAYSILADKALLEVVRTATGLPESLSLLDIDKQAEILSSKIDIEDFQDPEKLQSFLTRFTAMWEIDNPSNPSQIPSLLLGQTTQTVGINADLLFTLQSLKLGGR